VIKSVKIDGVDCRIGQRTKKPSTITMVVDGEFVLEALRLFEYQRKGEDPKEGLKQIKLVAEYVVDKTDEIWTSTGNGFSEESPASTSEPAATVPEKKIDIEIIDIDEESEK